MLSRRTNSDCQSCSRGSAAVVVVAALVLLAVAGGVTWWLITSRNVEDQTEPDAGPLPEVRDDANVSLPQIPFVDVTRSAGIDFVHENGAAGEKLLPETMGGGGGFLDYDNDGDQDLFLVNSRSWSDLEGGTLPATQRLYQNNGSGTFTDVTAESGLGVTLYGMGCAFGDYDGDGDVDIFISAVGANRMFRNDAGQFTDVTDETGLAGDSEAWSSGAGWFDYDRDGDLDLMVCNYLQWSREADIAQNFQLTGGGRAYGRPQDFPGTFPYLYRNENGVFEDVTESAGLQIRNPATNAPMAKSLGLTFFDFDDDGWLDLFVANDTVQNFLFRNQQDGTFEEIGGISGVAFDIDGRARGAMGVDAAWLRSSASVGVAVGNFANEMTALYVSPPGRTQFSDEAVSNGLGPATRQDLTFGTVFFDADLDGNLDLISSNGHLEEDIQRVQPSQRYQQPPRLFWNAGPDDETEFWPLSETEVGKEFMTPLVGRGVAYADIDGDLDLDVLLMTTGEGCRLLRNETPDEVHRIRFQLVGEAGNVNAIGAVVTLKTAAGVQTRAVMPTCSYLSQIETAITFGLGEEDAVEDVSIRWPDGTRSTLKKVAVDALNVIRKADVETTSDP